MTGTTRPAVEREAENVCQRRRRAHPAGRPARPGDPRGCHRPQGRDHLEVKVGRKARKDYRALGVPAEFLNDKGGFKGPGFDAKLKSRLIGEALEAEGQGKRPRMPTSCWPSLAGPRIWTRAASPGRPRPSRRPPRRPSPRRRPSRTTVRPGRA
jgi:hypothetical protein